MQNSMEDKFTPSHSPVEDLQDRIEPAKNGTKYEYPTDMETAAKDRHSDS